MAPPCEVEGACHDRTDPGGTFRPNFPPSQQKGQQFQPLQITYRNPLVHDLPDTPIQLFQRLVPIALVESWANATNEAAQSFIKENTAAQSRKHRWRDTSAAEIYVFLAIVICLENHQGRAIETFWKTPDDNNLDSNPFYFFTRHMSLARFQLLFRYLRIFDDTTLLREAAHIPAKLVASKSYKQVNEWSRHIQEEMGKLYTPGTMVAVDECMQAFTGRSDLKTHIPNKPTPDGIKIWVIAQDGIFLRWLWHEPGKGAIGLTPSTQLQGVRITPTQRVVVSLLQLLPPASYHIFLDNLFSSPELFKYLYDNGIGASGTARINCGIHEELVTAKKKPDISRQWGWTMQIPTQCGKVNQIAWQDNDMVLFLSTVHTATDLISTLRRRPRNVNTASKKAARKAFLNAPTAKLDIPRCIDEYNHHMGAVDIGDQCRSSYSWKHRWRRARWQPLGWGFLLGTVLVNGYKLHSMYGTWKGSHFAWRTCLATQLFETFSPEALSRCRSRTGLFIDHRNTQIPVQSHVRGSRGKRAACKVCQSKRIKANRNPLAPCDVNSVSKVGRRVGTGCLTCDVALCSEGPCWDIFHTSKLGNA